MATGKLIIGAAALALLLSPAVAQTTYKGQSGSLDGGATLPDRPGPDAPADKTGINPTLGEGHSSGSGSGGNTEAKGSAPPNPVVVGPLKPGVATIPSLSLQQRSDVASTAARLDLRVAKNIDITDVSPGARLPEAVEQSWSAMPDAFLKIVPEWHAFRAVKIRDETVIVEPTTRKVVHIIDG